MISLAVVVAFIITCRRSALLSNGTFMYQHVCMYVRYMCRLARAASATNWFTINSDQGKKNDYIKKKSQCDHLEGKVAG